LDPRSRDRHSRRPSRERFQQDAPRAFPESNQFFKCLEHGVFSLRKVECNRVAGACLLRSRGLADELRLSWRRSFEILNGRERGVQIIVRLPRFFNTFPLFCERPSKCLIQIGRQDIELATKETKRRKTMNKRRAGMILSAALIAAQFGFAGSEPQEGTRIEQQVRRELVTLPYYNLFDSFSFRVDGDTAILMGKVTRPTLKSDAEKAVQKVEGIKTVSNQIEVLPLSSNDDGLRVSLFRAIYGHSALQTLAIRAVPPIHILVEHGNVTLEGAVGNSMQKTIAGVQANTVPGVFSVVNNLLVDNGD
jgi:hyperosmotically inducible protein